MRPSVAAKKPTKQIKAPQLDIEFVPLEYKKEKAILSICIKQCVSNVKKALICFIHFD